MPSSHDICTRFVKVPFAGLAGVALASCAAPPPTSATPGQPDVFASTSQCTSPVVAIAPNTAGQFAAWANGCVAVSQQRDLSREESALALQNASRLFYHAGTSDPANSASYFNSAAQRMTEASAALTPQIQSELDVEFGRRYQFDRQFAGIAPKLQLGLLSDPVSRNCGTVEACLSQGLTQLRAQDVGLLRPAMSDTDANYRRAAGDLQILHAKADAALAKTSPEGNVNRGLQLLKSIVSQSNGNGDAALEANAREALLDIAEEQSDALLARKEGYNLVITYLTDAVQVAGTTDPQRAAVLNLKLGTAYEGQAGLTASPENIPMYCNASESYLAAFSASDPEVGLDAREGYAYALAKIAETSAGQCGATTDGAIAAYEQAGTFRRNNGFAAHVKHKAAYGNLLSRVGLAAEAVAVFEEFADRGLTTTTPDNPTPGTGTAPSQPEPSTGNLQASAYLQLAREAVLRGDPVEAKRHFASAELADPSWPVSFLEHAKYLASLSETSLANSKLDQAINAAKLDPRYTVSLAEAYYERSRTALGAGAAQTAVEFAELAVVTNSSAPGHRRQACLSTLLANKGKTDVGNATLHCGVGAQTAEDVVLNGLLNYREAQIKRRLSPNNSVTAFRDAKAKFDSIEARADRLTPFAWPIPTGDYTPDAVAQFGSWLSEACGSPAGEQPPRPAAPAGQDLEALFTIYGLASCDGR
ncbi:MAG: hypothetical protein QNI84_10630 [Henriciella sp.]|nr:hypothetical protein [Henriciella sp.]